MKTACESRSVNKGSVLDKDISKEPDFRRLVEVMGTMTGEERKRTLSHCIERYRHEADIPNKEVLP